MRTFLAATGVTLTTDRTVRVSPNNGCSGRPEGWLAPGGRATMNGSAVAIDQPGSAARQSR
ncbi:hypothetical protein JQK87_16515 [Streptomyces sp. G44]|uniref:hypothetical protein n=1 Tax=Streptomyces sp. G44 TaxID=2807632 RepID=UPI001961DCC3|nr:hypothetical protein [Streptomyces sp. G44]MBM7169992.1 hypothetical protein [Streptomyces sp. G44]